MRRGIVGSIIGVLFFMLFLSSPVNAWTYCTEGDLIWWGWFDGRVVMCREKFVDDPNLWFGLWARHTELDVYTWYWFASIHPLDQINLYVTGPEGDVSFQVVIYIFDGSAFNVRDEAGYKWDGGSFSPTYTTSNSFPHVNVKVGVQVGWEYEVL